MTSDLGDEKPARLIPTKPETETAAELKKRFEDAIAPALAIMDQAGVAGLAIQFDGIGLGPFYKNQVMNLRVVKKLA